MQRTRTLKDQSVHIPRGWIVLGGALLSWALFIAAWNAVAASFAFLIG